MKRITLAALAAATIAFSTPALAGRGGASAADGATMTNDGHYVPRPAQTAREPRGRAGERRRSARQHREDRKAPSARAERAQPRQDASGTGSGLVRSKKTGATTRVDGRMLAKAQAFIDELERHGARIEYMGGWRRGRCSLGSQHPCGGGQAIDVCQRRRGVVDQKCRLPPPATFHRLARESGLYEGSIWCSSDYGHAQLRNSGSRCSAPHGYGANPLPTMTGKMVDPGEATAEATIEVSASKAEPRRRHRRRVAHRHHRQRHVASAG